MAEREFDSITGVPVYPVQNCEYPVSCSYPYCTCRVPHDQFDQPLKARSRVDYTFWLGWILIITGVLVAWTAIILELRTLV
jgi:hypothetical protein